MDKAPADGGLGVIEESVICGWLSKRVTSERRRCRSADARRSMSAETCGALPVPYPLHRGPLAPARPSVRSSGRC